MTMKNLQAISTATRSLAVAGLLSVAAGPGAAEPGPYLGVHVGRNDLSSWPAAVDFGAGVRADAGLGLDRGASGGLLLGRETEHARFEVEYQGGQARIATARAGALSQAAAGRARYDLLTFNAYGTKAFTQRLSIFAGAGAGWGRVSLPRLAPLSGCNCFADAKRSGLAYQLRLGGEFALGASDRLFLQYSWMRLPSATGAGIPSVTYERRTVGVLGLGYRHHF